MIETCSLALLEAELAREDDLDLGRAALAIAWDEYPGLEIDRYLRRLDDLGARVHARRVAGADPLDQVEALRAVLAGEEGFRGNRQDYADPRNSFLNEVLDRRLGIPITLSTLYTEVGRRAGIPLFGVAFPGHFCAGVRALRGAFVIDAFDGGSVLDLDGCRDLLARVAPAVQFVPEMITPARPSAVVSRMLTNLKRVYLEQGDGPRALRIVNLLLAVQPDHPGELRARVAIEMSLGHTKDAIADIERCLALSPRAPDARSLELTARSLRGKLTYVN